MPLMPGARLGPYEITAHIGAGGMGEVYRATDTRLDRPVAVKIAVEEFTERFEREARAISSLSHPHICTLYDVGSLPSGAGYLVMELLDGETLARHIARGPMPLPRVLEYAEQMAGALAAAHARGVVHRDLKPGNVVVTKHGVKVLDFGLARLDTAPASTLDASTRAVPLTEQHAVLGTRPYMSPEQVQGKDADARSDIFSFGVVLYEMITGARPFEGDNPTALSASILKDEPKPIGEALPGVPRSLERVLRRCLEKDPADRWQSAQDLASALALVELNGSTVDPGAGRPMPAGRERPWTRVAALTGAVGLAVLAGWALWPTPAPSPGVTRFEVPLPQDATILPPVFYASLSPDGSTLAFTTVGANGGIWIRDLSTLTSTLLPDTQGVIGLTWAPDSRSIAFGRGNELFRVDLAGGRPTLVATSPDPVGSGFWTADGEIVFGGRGRGPLRRVSANGGEPVLVTSLDQGRGENSHSLPSLLPDGRHFLYLRSAGPSASGVYVGDLDAAPENQSTELVLPSTVGVHYVPPAEGWPGYMLFLRDSTVIAQPFDDRSLRLTGTPVPIVRDVGAAGAHAHFSASVNGAITYWTGIGALNASGQLTWFDRQGTPRGTSGEPRRFSSVAISPDATRAMVEIWDTPGGPGDLYLHDLERGVTSRFTFHDGPDSSPVWSPDSRRVVFASLRERRWGLYEAAANDPGGERLLFDDTGTMVPTDWSTDGAHVLYQAQTSEGGWDIWALPMNGGGAPFPVLQTEYDEGGAVFVAGGQAIAYASTSSGSGVEVWMRRFAVPGSDPPDGGAVQVSRGGAAPFSPLFRNEDGGELLFLSGPPVSGTAFRLMTVGISADPELTASAPRLANDLPLTPTDVLAFDVTDDGQRMLASVAEGTGPRQLLETPIVVVLNWRSELPQR